MRLWGQFERLTLLRALEYNFIVCKRSCSDATS